MMQYSWEALRTCVKPDTKVTVRNDLDIPMVVAEFKDLENYDCSIEHECIGEGRDRKDVLTAWMVTNQVNHLYGNSRSAQWVEGSLEDKLELQDQILDMMNRTGDSYECCKDQIAN